MNPLAILSRVSSLVKLYKNARSETVTTTHLPDEFGRGTASITHVDGKTMLFSNRKLCQYNRPPNHPVYLCKHD